MSWYEWLLLIAILATVVVAFLRTVELLIHVAHRTKADPDDRSKP